MGMRRDLLEAIDAGELDRLKYQPSWDDWCPESWDELDEHPLLSACASATPEIVAIAFASEAPKDALNHRFESRRDDNSLTPLAAALLGGNHEVAAWLVAQGADVNAEFKTHSAESEEIDIARFFGDDDYSGFRGFCWWLADDRLLALMRTRGLKPDLCIWRGESALIRAIERGDETRVKQLLELGADPDICVGESVLDKTSGALPGGATALMAAAHFYRDWPRIAGQRGVADEVGSEARLAIVSALLGAGAQLSPEFTNYVDGMKGGATVCDWVLEYGNDSLLELFGLRAMRDRLRQETQERDDEEREARRADWRDYHATFGGRDAMERAMAELGGNFPHEVDTRTVLSVMPDFGMAPFLWIKRFDDEAWGNCCDGTGPCGQHSMTDALWRGFREWAIRFDSTNLHSEPCLDFDWQAFHRDGLRLAQLLKGEVGEEFRVVYVKPHEDPDQANERREILAGGGIRELPGLRGLRKARH